MTQYKHILVAVDLSPESKHIVERAQDLQALNQATLTLAHVVDDSLMIYAGAEFALPINLEYVQASLKEAEERMRVLATTCHIHPEHCQLLRGEKENELVQQVHDRDIDLLVLGAHDKHGFKRLFSSTPESLLHALPSDILIIKQP